MHKAAGIIEPTAPIAYHVNAENAHNNTALISFDTSQITIPVRMAIPKVNSWNDNKFLNIAIIGEAIKGYSVECNANIFILSKPAMCFAIMTYSSISLNGGLVTIVVNSMREIATMPIIKNAVLSLFFICFGYKINIYIDCAGVHFFKTSYSVRKYVLSVISSQFQIAHLRPETIKVNKITG